MDFSLTDDQELLRDTAHKLLDRECGARGFPSGHLQDDRYLPATPVVEIHPLQVQVPRVDADQVEADRVIPGHLL